MFLTSIQREAKKKKEEEALWAEKDFSNSSDPTKKKYQNQKDVNSKLAFLPYSSS